MDRFKDLTFSLRIQTGHRPCELTYFILNWPEAKYAIPTMSLKEEAMYYFTLTENVLQTYQPFR